MGLFGSTSKSLPAPAPRASCERASNQLPISPIDLEKRYDVYCSEYDHDRLYEDVRFICMRTFERITEYSPSTFGGFLELEAADGSRFLIQSFGVHLIAEHGTQPQFKVLRRRRTRDW
jgi:hypothetical protein